jgi:hypothetical protein
MARTARTSGPADRSEKEGMIEGERKRKSKKKGKGDG